MDRECFLLYIDFYIKEFEKCSSYGEYTIDDFLIILKDIKDKFEEL